MSASHWIADASLCGDIFSNGPKAAVGFRFHNFLRTLATPELIKDWSLTSLNEKLIKIGAKAISHGRYVAVQMAEVAIPRQLFADILQLIAVLRPPPDAEAA